MLAAGAAELLSEAEAAPGAGGVTVYLVGAGPGDPGLMTARALELIAAADVIVYDRLIPADALAGARPDAQLIYAGKEGGGPSVSQEEIAALLVEHGGADREVVRLKGGDPFVFGRGGEEAEALLAAGIRFEVVPGITAGVAAAAYAGIPVTHRNAASAVAFVTGHEDPTKAESVLDWRALAAFPGTLVVYMGVRQLDAIAELLIAGGRTGSEPAAVIERGTLPDQRVVTGTLESIASVAAEAAVRAPAIALFGPVAALRRRLAWFEKRPLAGRTVAVTRARAQASGLASRLRALGAEVLEAPAIRIAPIAGPAPQLQSYDLVCLTSPNAVPLLFARLTAEGLDARAFAGVRVAAIGPGTAAALREHGLIADIVPERFVAEGLIEALADVPITRVLLARAAQARDTLPDALRERGAEVDIVTLYETVAEPLDGEQLDRLAGADYVTFTSSSTVRFLLQSAGGRLDGQVAHREHRTGHERDIARTRDHGRRRGHAPRHRRPRSRPLSTTRRRADMQAPIITFLSDYGLRDEFVGVCHGVIVSICPQARVIDLTHGVRRYDVRQGALILAQALFYLPVGVHLAVVDPGVGGDRRAVAVGLADGRLLVGPDNGLLSLAAARGEGIVEAVDIAASPFCLQPISATFHGRDIFAPVAAALAAGEPLSATGEPIDATRLVTLELGEPRTQAGTLVAHVRDIDRFGNVQLDGLSEHLADLGIEPGGLEGELGSRVDVEANRTAIALPLRAGRSPTPPMGNCCCTRTPTRQLGGRRQSWRAPPGRLGTRGRRRAAHHPT